MSTTTRPAFVSGNFPDFSKKNLRVLLSAHGYSYSGSLNQGVEVVFSSKDDAKVQAARARGAQIVSPDQLREVLGAPLSGFLDRLKARIAQREPDRGFTTHILAAGEPASPEVLARVEERIGFDLPEDARQLWSQLNGLSILWLNSYGKEPPDPLKGTGLSRDSLIPWSEGCHDGGTLWTEIERMRTTNNIKAMMGLCCIPPVETIFETTWDGVMFSSDSYGAKDKLKIGRRKVNAKDFFANLFMFDLFHPYYQAGLWADREKQTLSVVYSSDHGADWEFAEPLSLELYMEQLVDKQGGDRIITPGRGIRTQAIKGYYGTTGHKVLDPFS
ncbi:MAG: hypothetical protein ACI8S6_000129 [Myxococcota bacterium]|jgi:hypothetical protein